MPHRQPRAERPRRDEARARLLVGLLWLALLLGACRTPTSSPPFFEVESAGGASLSLLGTIHVGPPEGWTLPRHVLRAIDRSDTLVLELDLGALDEEAISDLLLQRGLLPISTSLSEVVSPETAALLEERSDALAQAGLPRPFRERLEPWVVAMMLTEVASQQSGYSPEKALDDQVYRRHGSKALIALETPEEQLAIFDELPLELQDALLRDGLLRIETASAELQALVEVWQRNDQQGLLELGLERIGDTPELEPLLDRLIVDRNRDWLPRLIELLESPRYDGHRAFVAVGALHLVGDMGVPALLDEAGYRVSIPARSEPVRSAP